LSNSPSFMFPFFLKKDLAMYVAQAGLELAIFLPQSPQCWDYRPLPPQLAVNCFSTKTDWNCNRKPQWLYCLLFRIQKGVRVGWLEWCCQRPGFILFSILSSSVNYIFRVNSFWLWRLPMILKMFAYWTLGKEEGCWTRSSHSHH
jgi:hypothetical protein